SVPAYFVECWANSPSNHPVSENPLQNQISAPLEASNKFLAGAAPVTTKFEPGSAANMALTLGSDQWSYAQAARLRSATLVPRSTGMLQSSQAPSSLRVVVVLLAS